jgi:hypothetical protein
LEIARGADKSWVLAEIIVKVVDKDRQINLCQKV